jgi:hypothetical protein
MISPCVSRLAGDPICDCFYSMIASGGLLSRGRLSYAVPPTGCPSVLPAGTGFGFQLVRQGATTQYIGSTTYLGYFVRGTLTTPVASPAPGTLYPSKLAIALKTSENGVDINSCAPRDVGGISVRLRASFLGGSLSLLLTCRFPCLAECLLQLAHGPSCVASHFTVPAMYAPHIVRPLTRCCVGDSWASILNVACGGKRPFWQKL